MLPTRPYTKSPVHRRIGRPSNLRRVPGTVKKVAAALIRYGGHPANEVWAVLDLQRFGLKHDTFAKMVARWRKRNGWHEGGFVQVRVEVVSDLCAAWLSAYPPRDQRAILRRIIDKLKVGRVALRRDLDALAASALQPKGGGG